MDMGWPDDITWYKLFSDWGSFIGGIFALAAGGTAYLAGVLQAKATRSAVERQLKAAADRDWLQARCIAVGISPELLQLQVGHERATKIFDDLLPYRQPNTMTIVPAIRAAAIELAPILSRNIDQLYILGQPAGPTLIQLCSVILQYNDLIDTLAKQVQDEIRSFNPEKHKSDLSGQMKAIALLIAEAKAQISPLHDEATGN